MRFFRYVLNRIQKARTPVVQTREEKPVAAAKGMEDSDLHNDWAGNMILKKIGSGPHVQYYHDSYSTYTMQWVSRETDENGQELRTRTPESTTVEYPKLTGFTVAGRRYMSIGQLTAKTDERTIWCKDCYGREVFCVRERFPCFDSFDYLHEDRYYRWFFLRENGKLWRVFYTDQRNSIYVTEDVEHLETKCWEQMEEQKYFSDKEQEVAGK